MTSRDLQNLELALVRSPHKSSIGIEVVHAQRTAEAALSLAVSTSGLDDKEIYIPLGIDAGHWSRIKKGEAGFTPNKMRDFCQLVGNTIYPEWIAYQVGCQLVMIQSEAERRAEAAERERDEARREADMLKKLLVGRAA